MPKEKLLHQLKQEFVTVSLSNYSKNLSDEQHKKIIETRKVFINTEGVEFFEAENFTWMDTRSFDYVGDSKQKMINRFENCKLKDCYRLYNGKMFRCLHHYAGYVTGKLHIDSSVVDINDIEDDSKLVDALNRFINVDYIDVCNYCELPFKAEAVSSGEQLI